MKLIVKYLAIVWFLSNKAITVNLDDTLDFSDNRKIDKEDYSHFHDVKEKDIIYCSAYYGVGLAVPLSKSFEENNYITYIGLTFDTLARKRMHTLTIVELFFGLNFDNQNKNVSHFREISILEIIGLYFFDKSIATVNLCLQYLTRNTFMSGEASTVNVICIGPSITYKLYKTNIKMFLYMYQCLYMNWSSKLYDGKYNDLDFGYIFKVLYDHHFTQSVVSYGACVKNHIFFGNKDIFKKNKLSNIRTISLFFDIAYSLE